MSEVTRILNRTQQGDPKAAEELLPLVYDELRKLAAHRMANEVTGKTLQPTALVHEARLRLVGNESPQFQNRGHFFGAAAGPCATSSLTAPASAPFGGGRVGARDETLAHVTPGLSWKDLSGNARRGHPIETSVALHWARIDDLNQAIR